MIINNLIGIWDMVHDDWRGTLVINPPTQILNGVVGPCTFTSHVIDGTYTTSNNPQPLTMRGTLGGQDGNQQTGQPCPQSDHLLEFTIAFPGQPPQRFSGYFFTHQSQGMAGLTWWNDIPFGWYAIRR